MNATATMHVYENVTPTAPSIEAKDYGIEAEAMSNEPVILAMAANLIFNAKGSVEDIMNEDSFGFMMAARQEAHSRGIVGSYIGAVERALRMALNRMAELDADMEAVAGRIIYEDNNREVEVEAVVGKVKRMKNSYYWAMEQGQNLGDDFKDFRTVALTGTDNILIIVDHAKRMGFPDEHIKDTTALVRAYQKRIRQAQSILG